MSWTSEKPKFKDDCVLVTADNINGFWEYKTWIIKLVNHGDGPYMGLLDGYGDEYGDIDDLQSEKYLIIPEPIK